MENNKEKTTEKNKSNAKRFSKAALLRSSDFTAYQPDFLAEALQDGQEYTLAEAHAAAAALCGLGGSGMAQQSTERGLRNERRNLD